MRAVPLLLVAAATACSKTSASVADDAPQAYAHASAALDADHPRTVPEFVRVIGGRPAACELRDATCVCTWRFMTKEGVKAIEAAAPYADARTSEPETVPMLARGNRPLDLPPDEAERGYRAGEYNAPQDGQIPVSNVAGELRTVPSEQLTRVLNEGSHIVSPRALKAAELEKQYRSWTEAQRLEACVAQQGAVRLVKVDDKTQSW